MIRILIEWYLGKKKKHWLTQVVVFIFILGLLFNNLLFNYIFGKKISLELSIVLSTLGYVLFISEVILETSLIIEQSLIEAMGKTNRSLIELMEGTKYQSKEPDIIKRILKIKLGEEITNLFDFENLPITLVPGGDIAMVTTQIQYKYWLEKLLEKQCWTSIKWTTFVPFEVLNQGLSITTEDDREKWNHRFDQENNYLNHCFNGNERFFEYISKWFDIQAVQKRQLIILSRESSHPLSSDKYFEYPFSIDLAKYLIARYKVRDKDNFSSKLEKGFVEKDLIHSALQKDEEDKEITQWVYLEDLDSLLQHKLHHLDFVIFQAKSRFVLIRVDPANYLKGDGGLLGITFLVYVEENVKLYEELFNTISNKAKHSFCKLVNQNINEVAESLANSIN